jgi:hypothetical protein
VKQRAQIPFLALVVFAAIAQLAACTGTPSTFYSVILTPSGNIYVAQNSTTSLSASVLNDAAAGGVTYSISPSGVGTLTQNTTTAATYLAPAVTASTQVIVTATSVDYPKSSSSVKINIEPPPSITTTSLPSGTINVAYTGSVLGVGGVPPLTWAVASGALPAGLSLGSSTNDTVNIVGKPTANGVSTFTLSLTDALGETAASQSLQIVISTLAITTTSPLPPATFTTPATPYSQQFAATGGTSPYTWTVASGSTLPAGLTLSSSGLLSGSPTAQGNFTFGITVTDSGTPPAAVTQTFTLSIAGPQNLALLTGNYAFTFSGNNATGYVATAGSFAANGSGVITAGEEDSNSISAAAPTNTPNLVGTYTLGSDGRGTITFTNAPGAPTYAFSIDTTGSHGRLIEFDSTGTRGSGRLEKQTVSTCTVTNTSTTYSGTFAYGGAGYVSTLASTGAGPLVVAGAFTASGPVVIGAQGSIGSGEADADLAGTIETSGGPSGSGTYESGPDATHCIFAFQSAIPTITTYSAYPVSSTEASPYISTLDLIQQVGYPFPTQGTISSSLAGGLDGQYLSGNTYLPEVAIAQLTAQAQGTFGLLLTDNSAGSVSTNMATTSNASSPFTVNYSSDQYGRITTNLVSPYQPVLYLVNSSEAFLISISNNSGFPVIGGLLQPQSTPTNNTFNAAYLTGIFPFGTTAPPSTAANNISGYFTLDGVSSITATEDVSATTGNTLAQSYAGTYTVLDETYGTGFVAPVAPSTFAGEYVIVSPTKFVMITVTTGDTNPVLLEVGN